ncbi:MAG: DUF86 domain-containing protein [Muribaculaceae bacterium]|nr:DUF86 domain-containing protein [Muribaculaceae bacterium]
MNRILKIEKDFPIPNAKAIINTRNRIIHAYDNVKPEFLWGLVIRHIPELKKILKRLSVVIIADHLFRQNIPIFF